jgi:sRNA-binding protein
MSAAVRKEKLRGLKEGRTGIEALQSLWPLAFPKKSHLVKPLASEVVEKIAERMGWSVPYTRGVLQAWKMRDRYCDAVLRYDRRRNLDGEETAETVDDVARTMATQRLAVLAERRLKARQAEQERAAAGAAEDSGSAMSASLRTS